MFDSGLLSLCDEGEEGVHQLGRQLLHGRAHLLAGDGFAVVNALLLREATQVLAGLGRSTLARGHVVTGSVLTGEAAHLGVVHGVNVPEVSNLGRGVEGVALLVHGIRGNVRICPRHLGLLLHADEEVMVPPLAVGGVRPVREVQVLLLSVVLGCEGAQVVAVLHTGAEPRFPDRENVGQVVVGFSLAGLRLQLAWDFDEGFHERGAVLSSAHVAGGTLGPRVARTGALKQVSHAHIRRLARGGLERGLDGLKARLREQVHVRLSSLLHAGEVVKHLLAGVRDGFVAPFRLVAREGDVAGQGGGSARLAQERSHVLEHGGHLHRTARVERTGSGGGGQGAGLADDVVFRHRP